MSEIAVMVGMFGFFLATGWYLSHRARQKAQRRAEAGVEDLLTKLGKNPKELTEAKRDPFVAMLDETHDPAQRRALVLAHLEPVFSEFLSGHTIKEFLVDDARIKGQLNGVPVSLLLKDGTRLAEVEVSCGSRDLEVDLEYVNPRFDAPGEHEVREQLGHEIVLSDDDEAELREQLAHWQRLRAPVRERVLKTFRVLETGRLRFRGYGIESGDIQLRDSDIGIATQRDPREKLRNVFLALQAAIDAVRSLEGGKGDAEHA